MIRLEEPGRLSQSVFWSLVIDYYERQGAAAWGSGPIPFRISCNAYIAKSYAAVIAGYLRDQAENGPVTIVELGAGFGYFGFLLLRALLADLGEEGAGQFRYVMTDVAESNLAAWQQHPALKPLIAAGRLELAVLDVGTPDKARLSGSGALLSEAIGGKPVVLIANYLLDSLVHDVFRVQHGVLHEERIALSAPEGVQPQGNHEFFEAMHFDRTPVPVSLPYYGEPRLDDILAEYPAALHDASFLFPVQTLRALEGFARMAGGQLLLLASDKARITPAQLEGHRSIGLTLTGAPSAMVNLDAVARWIRAQSGQVFHPRQPRENFDSYGFLLGDSAHETGRAYALHMGDYGPAAFWRTVSPAMKLLPQLDPQALVALADYDPYVTVRLESLLVEAAKAGEVEDRKRIAAMMEEVWKRHFFLAGGRDTAFTLGQVFRALKMPERALFFYQQSLAERGSNARTMDAMARCEKML